MLTQNYAPAWVTDDPDAITLTIHAIQELADTIDTIELLSSINTLDDPKHRDVLRTTLEAALAALRKVEDYDDATITASIATIQLGEVA